MPLGNRREPRASPRRFDIDVIWRGRLDMGFIQGVPFELSPPNTNPADWPGGCGRRTT